MFSFYFAKKLHVRLHMPVGKFSLACCPSPTISSPKNHLKTASSLKWRGITLSLSILIFVNYMLNNASLLSSNSSVHGLKFLYQSIYIIHDHVRYSKFSVSTHHFVDEYRISMRFTAINILKVRSEHDKYNSFSTIAAYKVHSEAFSKVCLLL